MAATPELRTPDAVEVRSGLPAVGSRALAMLLPIAIVAALVLARGGVLPESPAGLDGGAENATPTELTAFASATIEQALTDGSGIEFEIVQTSTITAREGGLRGQDRMYDLTVDIAHTFYVGDGGWLVHNADRCKLRDVTLPSERAARRQAFRDHNIPTSTSFTRQRVYGSNPNLRGRRGEPSEIVRGSGGRSVTHHSNGHRFPDRTLGPHYHGRGRHIFYRR